MPGIILHGPSFFQVNFSAKNDTVNHYVDVPADSSQMAGSLKSVSASYFFQSKSDLDPSEYNP